MACTAERLASLNAYKGKLEAALFSGAREVQHEGKKVSFNSVDDLQETMRLIDAEIAKCAGRRTTRVVKMYANRGYS